MARCQVGNVIGCFAERIIPMITTVFPRNKNCGTQFSKFQRKRVLRPNSGAVGRPCIIYLAWKNKIF